MVDYASKVLRHGTPELIKDCESGNISISKAAKMIDQDGLLPRRNTAPAKPAKTVKGILWKEAAFATCPRHEDGLHHWGDEDCEKCHEPKPACRELESLYDVTRSDIPLEARTKVVLKAMTEPDVKDRLGHSYQEALYRSWRGEFDNAIQNLESSAMPYPHPSSGIVGEVDDKAVVMLLAVCATLDAAAPLGVQS